MVLSSIVDMMSTKLDDSGRRRRRRRLTELILWPRSKRSRGQKILGAYFIIYLVRTWCVNCLVRNFYRPHFFVKSVTKYNTVWKKMEWNLQKIVKCFAKIHETNYKSEFEYKLFSRIFFFLFSLYCGWTFWKMSGFTMPYFRKNCVKSTQFKVITHYSFLA